MSNQLLDEVAEFVEQKFKSELSSDFSYHNFDHTVHVVNAVKELSGLAQLDPHKKQLLIIAAYFHDLGFINDPENHEYESQILAKNFLEKHDVSDEDLSFIVGAIGATKMDWQGDNEFYKLLRDADLSGLASKNYTEINNQLRKEIIFRRNEKISKSDWLKTNIGFLKDHNYLTKEGQELYNQAKLENLKKLKLEKAKRKQNKEPQLLTIASSKSAQTQFKTALRNHIDLSSIADNKANIMLSVNAVIITVGLPLLMSKMETVPNLCMPTIILALTSLVSMIFATLSTRPIAMNGMTTMDQIKAKKSNLFFFGNYYNMNFNDYEQALKLVVADNTILDNSITRDLFFLGKSLGKKYEYLRWCYNIFMYGIALSVLSFFIMLLLPHA